MKSLAIGAAAVSAGVVVVVVLGLLHLRQGSDVRDGENSSEDRGNAAGTRMRQSFAGRPDESGGASRAAPIDAAQIDCGKRLSELASNSAFMAEQMQRRVQSHMHSLSGRGFGELERALVAEAAGLRCATSACYYEHVSLRDAPRLRALSDAYFPPTSKTSVRSAKADEARALRAIADAIEDDMPAFEFDALLSEVQTDLNATWRSYKMRRYVNLAAFAALSLRPDHLRALLRHGASPALEGHSALDDLAFKLPLPEPREGQLIDIVRQLVQAGERAFSPHALSLLERLVPDALGLDVHPRAQQALAAANLEAAGAELATLVAAWERDIDAAARLEKRCAERGHATVDHTSLAAKMRREESRRLHREADLQRMREELQRASEKYEDHPDAFDPNLKAALAAMSRAINEERWEDVVALAGEWLPAMMEQSDTRFELILSMSIWRNAPVDVIGQLTDLAGGVLPPHTILSLVGSRSIQGTLDAIRELEAMHGLNIHFASDDGLNAMTYLAMRFGAEPKSAASDESVLQLARYLGERGVAAKPSPAGFDALDIALSGPRSIVYKARFVRVLLAAGASLERSHFELASQLRERHPDAYRRLVAMVPELARPP